MIARPLRFAKGFDTSQVLTRANYATLRALGFEFGVRYAPLSGMAPDAPGVIGPAELADALAEGHGMMLVQFARTEGWSETTGAADGEALAEHVLARLGMPAIVSCWGDFASPGSSQLAIDYANAWYLGATRGGLSPMAPGGYFEPGYPLSAEDRYAKLHMHGYWATGADDPAKLVARRGCKLFQGWVAPRGEYAPAPGILIDGDTAQSDFFGGVCTAVFAA